LNLQVSGGGKAICHVFTLHQKQCWNVVLVMCIDLTPVHLRWCVTHKQKNMANKNSTVILAI